ncbi:hypothetical protein [Litorimonas sp. WD9-15]|uniref:hypothetical protein n=1 Tax=Litorimonas sp. WD9-15 TaxID=3418716 RepID=UPI003D005E9D
MSALKKFVTALSYKEAQAWVFMIVNILVIAIYSKEVFSGPDVMNEAGLPAVAGLIIVGVCTTIFTILLIIPTAIIFNRTANDPADERDKKIRAEGGAVAFWTLFILTASTLISYVAHQSGDMLFHSVLIAILAAQFIFACVLAIKYRRIGAPLISREQV